MSGEPLDSIAPLWRSDSKRFSEIEMVLIYVKTLQYSREVQIRNYVTKSIEITQLSYDSHILEYLEETSRV